MTSQRKALIIGATGQDGAHLSRLLLKKGYVVHGTKRRASQFNTARLDRLMDAADRANLPFHLHFADLTDPTNIASVIAQTKPDEIYNLGAQSHVRVSFDMPYYTAQIDALGALNVLEALRSLGMQKRVRFYQASTSELYGKVRETPQTETTPFYPRSPYAVAKLYGYWITVNYREAYGIHASNGILFNHEGPLRGETFVSRKITLGVAAIALGKQTSLTLGNLDAKRDWGHARDYVDGMWRILQQEEPDDYVLATGETHTVREFVEGAFALIGRRITWQGEGLEEKGVDEATGAVLVKIDPRYFRPTEVDLLLGDARKARERLGWSPTTNFKDLLSEMVNCDLEAVKRGLLFYESEDDF